MTDTGIKITATISLADANTMVAALRHWQAMQRFNTQAVNSTEDERIAAHGELLRTESILRRFGVDPKES